MFRSLTQSMPYIDIQSLQDLSVFSGQIVAFYGLDEFKDLRNKHTLFGDNLLFAYIDQQQKKAANGDSGYNFFVFTNAEDKRPSVFLTSQNITNLKLRLPRMYEVEEINDLLDDQKISIDMLQEERRFLDAILNAYANSRRLYEHFEQHPNTFQGSLPHVSKLPERSKLMDKIGQKLDEGPVHLTALTGMTGCGKTILAKQYIQANANKYIFRAYFNAENQDSLYADYIKLAEEQAIPYPKHAAMDDQLITIRIWLQSQLECLFVYDNLTDLSLQEKYVPIGKNHVLLVTKDPNMVSGSREIHLSSLSTEDAKILLQDICPRTANFQQVESLINALGGLPLALAQAATYMERKYTACQRYLYYLENPKLLPEVLSSYKPYPNLKVTPIWLAFTEELKKLEQENHFAFLLLQQMSQLRETWIERDNLSQLMAGIDGTKKLDVFAIDDAIADLNRHSLLEFSADLNKLNINPLLKNYLLVTSQLTNDKVLTKSSGDANMINWSNLFATDPSLEVPAENIAKKHYTL